MSFPRRAAVVLGAGLSGIALTLAVGLPAQAASTGWSVVFTHHYGPAKDSSGYLTVLAPASHNAWAFGGTDLSGATPGAPVAEHWTGSAWHASPLPGGLTGQIVASSADSPKDIWAVTQFGGNILHWNGTAWSVAKRLTGSGQLTGVTALSPANVWVFGGSGFTNGLGTWHYDGTTWTQQTGNAAGLDEASALSPASIWAVGSTTAPENAIMHYNGTTWTQVKSSALTGLQFSDILALAKNNIWVPASAQSNSFSSSVLHYTGSGWTSIKLPWRVSLARIASDGHGGVWLAARDVTPLRAWAVHVSATGQLSRTLIGSSQSMFGLALIPGTTSLWGAGMTTTAPAGAEATIWGHGTP